MSYVPAYLGIGFKADAAIIGIPASDISARYRTGYLIPIPE
jgi:hypothetical protein